MNDQRLEILEKVQKGELSLAEAEQLLKAVEEPVGDINEPIPTFPPGDPPSTQSEAQGKPDLGWWKNAWLIPVWVGTFILVLSAWLLSWAYSNERFFWFTCSWLPFTLGMLVLFFGVWSRQARWVHVRVQAADGPNIAISVPLPLRLASWALHFFGPRIPELKEKHLENLPEILEALENTKEPLSVEVDDKGGDRVRVFIQ